MGGHAFYYTGGSLAGVDNKAMGIQIHKVIGYGIDNIRWKGAKFDDPRFDADKLTDLRYKGGFEELYEFSKKNVHRLLELLRAEKPFREEMTEKDVEDYFWFPFRLIQSDIEKKKVKKSDYQIYNHVHFSDESCRKAMVFIPFGYANDWFRYDDIIDYVEETNFQRQRSRVKRLRPFGIFPHCGSMIRVRPAGEGVSPETAKLTSLPDQEYSMMAGYWDRKQAPLVPEADVRDLKENWRCSFPPDFLALVLYFESALKVPIQEFLADFRPLLMTYWS